MPDQPLTRLQIVSVLVMFCFGSSVVMGVSTAVAQDAWISLTLGVLYAAPLILVYARIVELNPGAHLFDAARARLGPVVGKIFGLLMSWYALHLCALVLRNFSEFIQLSSLLDTPQLPVAAIMLLTVATLARGGGKALGKWALAPLPIVRFIVLAPVVLSLGILHPAYILPIMEHPPMEIAGDAFQIFSFPFTETVMFLGIADLVRPGDHPRRLYLGGTGFSYAVLMVIILRNLLVLGPAVVSVEYFPSYIAARIISLGDFLSRIEGSISANFMLAGITKIALCLITASRGIASLFGVKDWRSLVLPTGLMALALAQILYPNTMAMFAFLKYYAVYALPFEVLLPLALWAASEIRARRALRAAGR